MAFSPLQAQNTEFTTTANTPIEIVLATPDGAVAPLTFSIDEFPQYGRLAGQPPALLYVPDPDFVGNDHLTYSVIDAQGQLVTLTAQLVVTESDQTDTVQTTFSTAPTDALAITLAQGTNYTIIREPEHGTLTGQIPNLLYQADEDFLGEDRFSYEVVIDGEVESFNVTISVTTPEYENMQAQIRAAQEEKARNPDLPGLSPYLARIVREGGSLETGPDPMMARALTYIDSDQIEVMIYSVDANHAEQAVQLVEAVRGSVRHVVDRYLIATVPIAALTTLGASEAIQHIDVPSIAIAPDIDDDYTIAEPTDIQPQYGPNLTEGVLFSNADAWHAAGFRGQGARIGIFANGFASANISDLNGCFMGAVAGPLHIPFTGGTTHGTALAEVICDMVPEAEVYGFFVDDMADFADGMDYFMNTVPVDTIDASILFPMTPGDGSDMASELIDIAALNGISVVVPMGSRQISHFEGPYRRSALNVVRFRSGPGGDFNYLYGPNSTDPFYIPAGTSYCFFVLWDDWTEPITIDFDLYLLRAETPPDPIFGGNPYDVSDDENSVTGAPTEMICGTTGSPGYYSLMIRRKYFENGGGEEDAWVQLFELDGTRFQYTYPYSSVASPATSGRAFAVSAADVFSGDIDPNNSLGPANVRTSDGGGDPLSGNGGYNQPQVTGPMNVTTRRSPSTAGLRIDQSGIAAAHVAGAASLVRSSIFNYDRVTTEVYLRNLASESPYGSDPGAPGYDWLFGHGYLWLGEPPCYVDTVGIFRDSNFSWYLTDSHGGGYANRVFRYGTPSDIGIAGDWDGNDADSIGIFRNGVFFLRNSTTSGYADIVVAFSASTDIPIAGDWNGDGRDTIGVYRPSTGAWYLRNSNTPGPPNLAFGFGLANEIPVVGDWDGDGIDTIGIFRTSNSTWYLRNSNSAGYADRIIRYGNPATDIPIVGDWDGDCIDTIGVYRKATASWLLRNSNTSGFADLRYVFGLPNETPITGDWNRN